MKKELTHEVVMNERVGFGKISEQLIKVRLLKNHIVDKDERKYRKDNGYLVGGQRYEGVYMENFSLDISTLKEIKATHL